MNSHAYNLIFYMPIWVNMHMLQCSIFGGTLYYASFTFPAIPSMTTTSSLKGQYAFTSFMTSALVDSQPCSIYIETALMTSSSMVVN